MMRYSALLVCVLAVLISTVSGHGHLSSPPYRGLFQASPPWYSYMDEAPTKDADGNNSPLGKDFVCRSNTVTPTANWTTLTAGSSLTVTWSLSAAHVGDCFLYLTFDGDQAESNMRWFKIYEQFECKNNNNVPMTVKIPEYIPSSSHAILRWEWYALHTFPNVEFYAQCVDVKVNGIANGVLGTPLVSIPGNLPPAKSANGTANYRDPYNTHDGVLQTFLTGPKLAVAGGPYTAPSSTSSSTPSSTSSSPSPSSTGVAPSSTTSASNQTDRLSSSVGTVVASSALVMFAIIMAIA